MTFQIEVFGLIFFGLACFTAGVGFARLWFDNHPIHNQSKGGAT